MVAEEEQIEGDKTATTEYTYDKRGNLVMVKSCMEEGKEPDGSSAQYVQYVYDVHGNKVRQFTGMTSPLTLTVSEVSDDTPETNKAEDTFTYAGKTYAIKVSGQKKSDDIRETKYEYDGKDRMTAYTDPEGRRESYTYDVNSNLTKTVDKNGNTLRNTYDYQNRLTAMKNQTGSAGVISEYSSEYLANGQKSKETSTIQDKEEKKETKTATYTYDLLGRITKETKTGSEDITYKYDSNNNRKEMTIGNKVTAYKYNKNDELLRTDTLNTDTEEDAVVIYKNDKNGNQLATVNRYDIPADRKDGTYIDIDVTLGDNRLNENVVNHYNAINQLTSTLTKDYKVSYTYDAKGLRTSKIVNGEKTVFVWDGDQVVMELSEGGKVQKRYIRGNDLVSVDEGQGTEKQYYATDPHGNVVQLSDESGRVVKTYEYDSFGNEVKPEKKDENPFRYCGEYYDKETEEVYLRARYYQPAMGRFLTRDTYTGEDNEPLSLHLYMYCGGNPINYSDSTGHKANKLYKNLKTAVQKFADATNKKSIKKNREYGTFFYKKGKKYAYTKPYKGTVSGLENFYDKLDEAKKKYKVKAWGHTHGSWSDGVYDDENFSRDGGDIDVSKYVKMDAFVATPGGKIKRYNYKKDKINHKYGKTFHDSRSRKEGHKCQKCVYV